MPGGGICQNRYGLDFFPLLKHFALTFGGI